MALKLSVLFFLLALVTCASAQTMITTCQELQDMSLNLAGNYALANDIDCSATSSWNSGAGFEPIGTIAVKFTGAFDGQAYEVNDLFINRPTMTAVGLFGYIDEPGRITSVGVISINVTGGGNVGGLAGRNFGAISYSYATGAVKNLNDNTGGLVGDNRGTVTTCYASSAVNGAGTGSDNVGGFVGDNQGGTISNSYATGTVTGVNYIGGFAGSNCGVISYSYAVGAVSGSLNVGGFLARESCGSTVHAYWNTQTTGQLVSVGGVGKSTAEMFQQATYPLWDFNCRWSINEDSNYPQLTMNNCSTFFVNTCEELQTAVLLLDASIYLSQDIDCADSANWDNGAGFVQGRLIANVFNGNGYIISDLIINRPSNYVVGLFARIDGNAQIYSVGLVDVNISAAGTVGSLVGLNRKGTITNTYATGTVISSGTTIAGLVGENQDTIINAYSTVSVTGSSSTGGLVGSNVLAGVATNSYWDTQTSTQASSAAGTGKTTSEMHQQLTYVSWDFLTIWQIEEGLDYPMLIPATQTSSYSNSASQSMSESPAHVIDSCEKLQNIQADLSGTYEIIQNIDCSNTATWNGGAGFEPIGTTSSPFTGTLNGNGYRVSNLVINRPSDSEVGLFGHTGSAAQINELKLIYSITGGNQVGAFVGYNEGTVTGCYASGTLQSNADSVGGIVGVNAGTVTSCQAAGAITGSSNTVGGLIGNNIGTLTNSYATTSVTGDDTVAGLVAYNQASGSVNLVFASGLVTATNGSPQYVGGLIARNSGTVSSSYWDTETSQHSASAAGIGRTTAEMYQEATYVGWDFTTIWWIKEDEQYPDLWMIRPPVQATESARPSQSPKPGNPGSGKLLSPGEKAAIIVPSVLSALVGIAYTGYKWYHRREEIKQKSQNNAGMTAL